MPPRSARQFRPAPASDFGALPPVPNYMQHSNVQRRQTSAPVQRSYNTGQHHETHHETHHYTVMEPAASNMVEFVTSQRLNMNVQRRQTSAPVQRSYNTGQHHETHHYTVMEPAASNMVEFVTSQRLNMSNQQQNGNSQNRRSHSKGFKRKWVHCEKYQTLSAELDKFVILTYNILGVINASKHMELYSSVPSAIMKWANRKQSIIQEINRWRPDVMCLQEVDRFDELANEFQRNGYSGIFKARTGEAEDGCAVFWKTKVFHLLEEDSIEFNDYGLRNNVAQICVFEAKGNRVVIANTHLLFNPKRGDIKLGQVRILLDAAYFLSQKWGGVPVVISGDFNATPKSVLYKYLVNSQLDLKRCDCRTISGQIVNNGPSSYYNKKCYIWTSEEVQNATGNAEQKFLQSPIQLSSAYAGVKAPNKFSGCYGEPVATTYHSNFFGTVDYIWHSNGLIPLCILNTLPHDVLRRTNGLPTEKWGSDHLCLVCELAFEKTSR